MITDNLPIALTEDKSENKSKSTKAIATHSPIFRFILFMCKELPNIDKEKYPLSF